MTRQAAVEMTQVHIRRDLWKALKVLATERECFLSDVLGEAVTEYLRKKGRVDGRALTNGGKTDADRTTSR